MENWLKTFLPRKYAVIDGRQVTEPIINGSDTTFTVTGDSNWGSTSKYNVHLQGPNSYYLYKTLSEPKDDPSAGGARQEQITVTGNEPERLNRYRGYLNSLAPEDYKYWWQQIFSKACGGKVEKAEKGMKTHSYNAVSRNEQDIPEETLIDRTGKHPRYTYIPGELKSHRFALDTKKVIPNLDRLMKPGEQRMYIDPTTNRILTYTGPVDPNISSVRYIEGSTGKSSTVDAMYQLPGQDIYLFPDGSSLVIKRTPVKIDVPRGDYQIPSNPNDNTSTRGSLEWGNIKGGVYPGTSESIQAPEGYNQADNWEETHDQVNGGVRKAWKNKKTGRITRTNPNRVLKGEDGMVAGEFSPTWNQGEIRQGFQKARPGWLQKILDVANDLNARPDKYGPLSMILGPAARYLTGLGGYEDMAAILPGIGVANAAGKAAVGKSAQLEKEIENAFKAKGLREQMAKWDLELITNANRDVINKTTPDWLDELTKYNNDYIKEIDLSNLIKKENPAKDLGIGLAGLSAVGIPGTYFIIPDSEKKKKAKLNVKEKSETKEKPEKKARGGKISDLLNNQEFFINLEKCGGKIKKACGGKMKKKK